MSEATSSRRLIDRTLAAWVVEILGLGGRGDVEHLKNASLISLSATHRLARQGPFVEARCLAKAAFSRAAVVRLITLHLCLGPSSRTRQPSVSVNEPICAS